MSQDARQTTPADQLPRPLHDHDEFDEKNGHAGETYKLTSPLPSQSSIRGATSYALSSTRRAASALRPTPAAFRNAAYFLTPSFLQHRLWRRDVPSAPARVHATAHLDGIRGLAAFCVFLAHFSYIAYHTSTGYGSYDPNLPESERLERQRQTHYILKLPILRLFYTGIGQVALFFVVSGYALSIKPLKLMRAGAGDSLLRASSSAAFRRGFRLFLPCMASTFIVLLLIQTRFYESTREWADSPNRAFNEYHKAMRGGLYTQFMDWYHSNVRFIWVWDFFEVYGGSNDYDLHLWTIPIEYRASLVLFLAQLAAARMKSFVRMAFFALLFAFAMSWGRWEVCLFFAGPILCEYDMMRAVRPSLPTASSPNGEAVTTIPRPSRRRRVFLYTLFVIGLYLLSYPESLGSTAYGYRWLSSIIPRSMRYVPGIHAAGEDDPNQLFRFWPMVGAIMTIFCINSIPTLAAPFNWPLIQYLGKISYALYLMHGPVMHTFGYHSMMFWWRFTGEAAGFQYNSGFMLSALTITPVLIWAADIFWRGVDMPVVEFSRWLESKLVDPQWS